MSEHDCCESKLAVLTKERSDYVDLYNKSTTEVAELQEQLAARDKYAELLRFELARMLAAIGSAPVENADNQVVWTRSDIDRITKLVRP